MCSEINIKFIIFIFLHFNKIQFNPIIFITLWNIKNDLELNNADKKQDYKQKKHAIPKVHCSPYRGMMPTALSMARKPFSPPQLVKTKIAMMSVSID